MNRAVKTQPQDSTANSTGRPDRLSALLERFRIRAQVHPVDSGADDNTANMIISGDAGISTLFYYPRGNAGADDTGTGAVVRASVDTGGASPIALALPQRVEVRLADAPALAAVADILIDEARAPRCGRRAVVDRLCEVVVIRLLRHLIETDEAEAGLLAGLAHPNLAPALIAIHENPDKPLVLEDLAARAAMSRTHFANTFRDVVGTTPGQYLTDWRLTLARIEIAAGAPVKTVAKRVGFSGAAALSRAFTRRFGVSPRQLRSGTERRGEPTSQASLR